MTNELPTLSEVRDAVAILQRFVDGLYRVFEGASAQSRKVEKGEPSEPDPVGPVRTAPLHSFKPERVTASLRDAQGSSVPHVAFGTWLRTYRHQNGKISQGDLADRLGYRQDQLSQIEHGRKKLSWAEWEAIFHALGERPETAA